MFDDDPEPTYIASTPSSRSSHRAPYPVLVVGLLASIAVFVGGLFVSSLTSQAVWALVVLWFASIITLVAPLASFGIIDLQRRRSLEYQGRDRSVRRAKYAYLAAGFIPCLFFTVSLATELARMLSVTA